MRAFQSNHARAALAGLVVALSGAAPVRRAGRVIRPARTASGESGDSGGEEEGAPRNLRPAFYKRAVTLVVFADGLHGQELPISIEAVCDVPEKLAKGAARLGGADGVVLRLHRTTVWENRALKIGPPATVLIEGADTALVRGRLTRPGLWRPGPGREPYPTFRAGRIVVAD